MPLIYDPSGTPVELAPGRGDLTRSSMPLATWTMNGSGATPLIGGKTVSYGQLFASQIWVAAAVMRLLSWSIRVPLKAYRRTGDDSRERLAPADHPLAKALIDPWEGGSQAALVQSLLGPLLIHGNGLTEIDEGRSGTIRFADVDWRNAEPIQPWPRRIAGWNITEDTTRRTVSADHVMHLAWWSPLGPIGISPLQQLGVTIGIEDAAQRYQQALFRNGARPPSAIEASEQFLGLDRTERGQLLAQLRADLASLYGGPENGGRPALLPPGLTWNAVGHSAVEAELIDQRKVAREEVAAAYLIPPPMLGILDKATYSNISVQREMAYTDSLGPPLVLIEQTINAHLVRGLLREDDVFVEFDFAGVLRGDRLKEMQALREAIDASLMTPNEGRSVLNMPKSSDDGMDSFYFRANNLREVGTTDPSQDEPSADPAPTGA
jgi:HK97 family phage portal protein